MVINHQRLVDEAKKALAREDVGCLIGYVKEGRGFRVSPLFARTERDAERLTFSPLCSLSLVNYLTLEKGVLLKENEEARGQKIAILARGCDSRALNQLIAERGIAREEIVILGVPCGGVIDLKKLEAKFPGVEACAEVAEGEGTYVVRFNSDSHEIPKDELLASHCRHCTFPNPLVYDILLDESLESKAPAYPDIEEVEKMPLDDKRKYWNEKFSRCLRCYACRNACPLCYCDDCILERLSPPWINRSVNLPENVVFHLARSFHLAGRCAGCGECERACPVNLPLMLLNRKLEKDISHMLQHTAGTTSHGKPVFASFDPKDPDDFIL